MDRSHRGVLTLSTGFEHGRHTTIEVGSLPPTRQPGIRHVNRHLPDDLVMSQSAGRPAWEAEEATSGHSRPSSTRGRTTIALTSSTATTKPSFLVPDTHMYSPYLASVKQSRPGSSASLNRGAGTPIFVAGMPGQFIPSSLSLPNLVEPPPPPQPSADAANVQKAMEMATEAQAFANELAVALEESKKELEIAKLREAKLLQQFELERTEWREMTQHLKQTHEKEMGKVRDECAKRLQEAGVQFEYTLEGKLVRLRGALEGQQQLAEKKGTLPARRLLRMHAHHHTCMTPSYTFYMLSTCRSTHHLTSMPVNESLTLSPSLSL